MSASASRGPAPQFHDRPVLSVSLPSVGANWRTLRDAAPHAEVAGVVKADAYGTGAEGVARKLKGEGCTSFFTATMDEAAALRLAVGTSPRIFVLNGLPQGAIDRFMQYQLIPVLNTLDEARDWAANGAGRPCALHVDTGMSRAGLNAEELSSFSADRLLQSRLSIALIISHLACADESDHPKNVEQLQHFHAALARLPSAPASFANSAGIFLGPDYHFDLVRPGIALYGGNPSIGGFNPMQPVVALTASVLGLRTIRRGETVGYGASFAATRETRLAVCNLGYADGVMRSLSSRGVAYIEGIPCRYAGRVSMDLLTLDVSDVPSSVLSRGTQVEILGPHHTLEDMAERAGTISYEILTSLTGRFTRVHMDGVHGRFA